MTIVDLLKIMNFDYALMVVSVNDDIVHQDDYASYVIDDKADVKIIHICHGG